MTKYFQSLCCIKCGGSLKNNNTHFSCAHCGSSFLVKDGTIHFREAILHGLKATADSGKEDSFIVKLKNWTKERPGLFRILNKLTSAVIGKTAKEVVRKFPDNALILNIGSGVKIVAPHVVNIDYDAQPGVNIVADIHTLPFQDESVDLVIAENVLEHVENPEKIISEIRRVLKKGGEVYIVTPFMLGYHSSPRDYYRWTHHGFEYLLEDFKIESYGPYWGPTTALVSILGGWLSLVLSFGSSKLYQGWAVFFMFALSPVTLLDHLIGKHPLAVHLAHGIWVVGRKDTKDTEDRTNHKNL